MCCYRRDLKNLSEKLTLTVSWANICSRGKAGPFEPSSIIIIVENLCVTEKIMQFTAGC